MEKPIHFRRCHVCGAVNHVCEGKVSECQHCGKSLAPFYYFDDSQVDVLEVEQVRPQILSGEYRPIQGLTLIW